MFVAALSVDQKKVANKHVARVEHESASHITPAVTPSDHYPTKESEAGGETSYWIQCISQSGSYSSNSNGQRFGSACLFATKKFEQYNGVLHGWSIHTNRQSPGYDIAITFTTYCSICTLLSGGIFYDGDQRCNACAGSGVIELFKSNSTLRQTMALKLPVPKEDHYDIKTSSAAQLQSCLEAGYQCEDAK
ncbi:hypothetical protein DFH28DRAFT_928481 [Melampsora americana]|nr:hypothetical protein DFH28DRAFT_928481 [Melampsora americana]